MSTLGNIVGKAGDSGNIAKAKSMFDGISRRDAALATKHLDTSRFVNHNLHAANGVDGVRGFISHLPPATSALEVVRAFEDGDYVFTHARGDVFGPKVFFDIFRFQDGKIVEHWDNLAEDTPTNASGHTATDGPATAEDLDKTEANKALIRDFYETVFLRADFAKMEHYFEGDRYIRHDPRGGDGLSALQAMMQEQAKQGVTMSVDRIVMILGQGNFVLVAASGAIANKPVAYYDLFRVENGKIAEHWDTIESIPPESEWRNQNGKF